LVSSREPLQKSADRVVRTLKTDEADQPCCDLI
jgi:hypothetical protein